MKIVSLLVSFIVFSAAALAQAQLRTGSTTSTAAYLKQERLQLEKDNEQHLLEMLEQQRLQEEKARLQRIESMSFNVVNPAPTMATNSQEVPVQTARVSAY